MPTVGWVGGSRQASAVAPMRLLRVRLSTCSHGINGNCSRATHPRLSIFVSIVLSISSQDTENPATRSRLAGTVRRIPYQLHPDVPVPARIPRQAPYLPPRLQPPPTTAAARKRPSHAPVAERGIPSPRRGRRGLRSPSPVVAVSGPQRLLKWYLHLLCTSDMNLRCES